MKTTQTQSEETQDPSIHAKNALSSILEMVRALDIETAAEDYAEDIDLRRAVEILNEYHENTPADYAELSEQAVRNELAEFIGSGDIDPEGFEFDEDDARQTINEDPLEISVRSDWYSPGETGNVPSEYRILLCTGGPAVRIIGALNQYGEPDSAEIQGQDWFTPWTTYTDTTDTEAAALLTYAQQFYYVTG